MVHIYNSLCLVFLVVALLTLTFCQPVGEERHRVLIVGAGVSGFTAAVTLLENNFTDFLVLEAADRIGGRIHTVQFGGVTLDKGAEFIHGEKGNVVYDDIIVPYVPELIESYHKYFNPENHIVADTSGNKYNTSVFLPLLLKAWDIAEENMGDFNGTLADYIHPRINDLMVENNVDSNIQEGIKHMIELWVAATTAADNSSMLGVRGEAAYIEHGDNSLKWNSKTVGYSIIFDILSKKFPNTSQELPVMERMRFNKEVVGIEYGDGDEVTVRCADGSVYRSEHVIVTVSLGVLKKHAEKMFQPPLPAEKNAAIQSLGFGCVGKVFILFPTRWWPTDINFITPLFSKQQLEDFKNNSKHGHWTAYTYGYYLVLNHDRMFCAWFSGDSCRTMESLTEEEVTDGLMELLEKLVGNEYQIPKPEGILRSGWGSYPYTLGSYSFHTPQSDALNVSNSHLAAPLMHEDKPVVMFAGEATNSHYWSTVHGALMTGRREATNLLKYLSKQE